MPIGRQHNKRAQYLHGLFISKIAAKRSISGQVQCPIAFFPSHWAILRFFFFRLSTAIELVDARSCKNAPCFSVHFLMMTLSYPFLVHRSLKVTQYWRWTILRTCVLMSWKKLETYVLWQDGTRQEKTFLCKWSSVALGCFVVVTFLIFSQGDCLFDIFMGVEVHDKKDGVKFIECITSLNSILC